MLRILLQEEQVAFVTLGYFSIRELLKLGIVCKRFYWLTGNQELISAV